MSDFFRSERMKNLYAKHKETGILDRECVLCTIKSIQEFKFWRIIPNSFPYDLIATEHNMLVPIRHTKEDGLTEDEVKELLEIKANDLDKYDYLIEAGNNKKSIPAHFHIHLVCAKDLPDEV